MGRAKRRKLAERIEHVGYALRVSEVASLLDVDDSTVYRWVRQNEIPALRVGSRVRFDPGTLADWLRSH